MKTAIIRMIKIMNSTMKTMKTIIDVDMPSSFFSITIFGGLGVGFVVRYNPSERKRNKVHVKTRTFDKPISLLLQVIQL